MSGKQSYRMKNVMRLLASMRPYRKDLGLTFLSIIVKYSTTIIAAGVSAYMVALAMANRLGEFAVKGICILMVCAVLRGAGHFGELFLGHKAAYQIQRDTRVKIYYKFDELAPAYMNRHRTASLGTMAMSDIEILEWFLAHTVVNLIATAIMMIAMCIVMYVFSPILSLFALIGMAVIAVIPFIGAKLADEQGKKVRETVAEANGVVIEGVQGITDFAALNYIPEYMKKQKSVFGKYYAAKEEYAKRTGLESAAANIAAGIYVIICMLIGGNAASGGSINAELFPVILALSLITFAPIIDVSASLRILGELFAAADRIQRLFDETAEVKDEADRARSESLAVSGGGTVDESRENKNIEFRDVSFSYEEGREVLHHVSFKIPYGKQVALVGPSGAGKTTCANLLLRYWDTDSGQVLLSGEDIRDLKLTDLRECTSAVLQDVYLFHISVMENIRLGRKTATDEEVIEAAKKANAHDFITGLPDGYATVTGERGFRLSGGQRQRISIARALLRDSKVLILDEAVSSLDAENECIIEDVMKSHAKGRTTLVIAHRLSTIMAADELVVMKDGCVVQQGTHEELIRTEGFYRELMERQK